MRPGQCSADLHQGDLVPTLPGRGNELADHASHATVEPHPDHHRQHLFLLVLCVPHLPYRLSLREGRSGKSTFTDWVVAENEAPEAGPGLHARSQSHCLLQQHLSPRNGGAIDRARRADIVGMTTCAVTGTAQCNAECVSDSNKETQLIDMQSWRILAQYT